MHLSVLKKYPVVHFVQIVSDLHASHVVGHD
jgi:hypothetical protein